MSLKGLRLGFLGLNCVRHEESKRHYDEVVGLPVVAETGPATYFACGSGSHALSLHRAERSRFRHLGLQIAGTGPLDDALAKLRSAGLNAAIKSDPLHGVPSAIELADPDGHCIYLYRDEAAAAFRFPTRGIRPEKLGHVALLVTDANRSERFYADTLGFRTSDWVENLLVFMRCNTDHHTLNFLNAPRPGMFHFAFELRDANDLMRSCDQLGKEKLRIEWGPGRHGPGHNLYTYHRDPERNIVELFAELDVMGSEDLGYFEPRSYHRDSPQRPKTWTLSPEIDIWGAPPPPGFTLGPDGT